MRIGVTYIVSNINKSLAFEWIAKDLDHDKFKLSFILLNDHSSDLEKYLISIGIPVKTMKILSFWSKILTFLRLTLYFLKQKPEIVHAHLYEAGYMGITAAWCAGVKCRIYTRHYSTLHHHYFPKGKLVDSWINRRATKLIAVSENVRQVLTGLEGVPASKVKVMHHGFELSGFSEVLERDVAALREKYTIPKESFPVVGMISRYTHWKGIQFAIPAFRKLLQIYPDAILILANANGDYKKEIEDILDKTLEERNYREIAFEADIQSLYQLFDVFVHVPIDNHSEAFGQIYVEAMAAGVPSVFTLSGVAGEFVIHKDNALIVDFQSEDAIFEALKELLGNSELRNQISISGSATVKESFSLKKMISSLETTYQTQLGI